VTATMLMKVVFTSAYGTCDNYLHTRQEYKCFLELHLLCHCCSSSFKS